MKSWWPGLLWPGVPGGPHHNISSMRSGALSLLFFTASSTPSRVSAFSRYSQVFVEWKNKWHDTQILLGFQSLYLQPHLFQTTTRVFPTILRDGRLPAIYMVKKVPWDKKDKGPYWLEPPEQRWNGSPVSWLSSWSISFLFFLICIFKNLFIHSFIHLWLHWVFVAEHGLSLVVASRGYSGATLHCGVRASHCGGFSLLRSTGSRRTAFSSCGMRAQ